MISPWVPLRPDQLTPVNKVADEKKKIWKRVTEEEGLPDFPWCNIQNWGKYA
jgi:hypothetical protein